MGELVVGTFNVRTLACNHNSPTVLQLCASCKRDVVDLQETRWAQEVAFTHLEYDVMWSGTRTGAEKGVHGIGLAIKKSTVERMEKGGMAVEGIRARLMKVRLQLTGSKGVFFVVVYTPTESDTAAAKNNFWLSVDRAVSAVSQCCI